MIIVTQKKLTTLLSESARMAFNKTSIKPACPDLWRVVPTVPRWVWRLHTAWARGALPTCARCQTPSCQRLLFHISALSVPLLYSGCLTAGMALINHTPKSPGGLQWKQHSMAWRSVDQEGPTGLTSAPARHSESREVNSDKCRRDGCSPI